MNHWLIKSEPSVYGYGQLEKEGRTEWTGIRNFQARNFLREMRPGDLALYYHTGEERQVVGIAQIRRAAAADPTSPKGEDWSSVEVASKQPLRTPVTLTAMKADAKLKGLLLLTRGRLSVVPVSPAHYQRIVTLGERAAP